MLPSLFFLLLLFSTTTITATNRRVLHQPFFPQDSQPPSSSPPTPSTTPKYPFDSSTPNTNNNNINNNNNTPFFPSFPSAPPPPSPSAFASFPANISSLILPHSSKSKSVSSKLIATAITCVIAALIVLSIVLFLHIRKKRHLNTSSTDTKTQRSNSSTRVNSNSNGNISSSNNIPKLQRPSQTSSEFLYLGTMVSSHVAILPDQNPQNRPSSTNVVNRKMDSPEIHPLPPLHGGRQQSCGNNVGVDFVVSRRTEEEEEFFSPRGSLDGSIGTGSASRRAFAAVEVENFGTSSSYSSSSSGSGSPVRSVSLSISPPASLSPKKSCLKSPELVAVLTVPPQPMPHLAIGKESASPSPPSSSSPERYSSRSIDSSPRHSDVWEQNLESPVRFNNLMHQSGPVSVPPPPPPPPPPPLPPVVCGDHSGGGSPNDDESSPSPPPISSAYYPSSAPHMLLALSTGFSGEKTMSHPITRTPLSTDNSSNSRKRFRTKFTPDQKAKMMEFAEQVGWKMQKRDDELINKFCHEIGVEKGVLKVWMHNNKNTVGKKSDQPNNNEDDDNKNNNGNGNSNGNGNGNENYVNGFCIVSRNNTESEFHKYENKKDIDTHSQVINHVVVVTTNGSSTSC